jgi:hypothetical protein
MLHVLNGDATRVSLEQAKLPGEITIWADVLHDGPTPGGLSRAEFRLVRATHLASRFVMPRETTLGDLQRWDAALDAYGAHDEVVFWLEHDLFDQAILLRHLHWLHGIEPGRTRFSLICIDRFPGFQDFAGLGQLNPRQLATLFPTRRPIIDEQIALGNDGWERFCAAEPGPLLEWLRSDTSALPFAHGALMRHIEDYPWHDGLSRTERQMLRAVADGATTFARLFPAWQRREERIYMGDSTFLAILRDLATAREPLITITGDPGYVTHDMTIAVTPAGGAVLAGEANHIALNGIDRWMGGVHLTASRHWVWSGRNFEIRTLNVER